MLKVKEGGIGRTLKNFKGAYRPLPNEVTIKQSLTDGLGLFATTEINDNHSFGITHHWIEDELIRTPLGGFVNHSDNPNCIIKEGLTIRTLHSIRKISEGEEILVQYTLY